MALIPIPRQINLQLNGKMKAEKKKRVTPIKIPKSPEVKYRKQLDVITKKLREETNSQLIPALKQLQPQYVNDAYALELEKIIDDMRRTFIGLNTNSKIIANNFVGNTNQANRQRFYNSIEDTIGVDLSNVIRNEDLTDVMVASTRENVSLIKSIPEEYFKKLETIVFTETTQGSTANSMIKQLKELGGVTTRRARLIARDQTAKVNSALTQQRSQNLGVEEYVWRTAGDGRVRDTHMSKNGKVFRWDKPPKDTGHPGHDIQCRCVAQPIIKL